MARGLAGSMQRFMHFFLPKEEDFFELFQDMSDHAHEGAKLLQKVMNGEAAAADMVKAIADVEHQVDHLRHNCVKRLNDTFVTPIMFDREDILALADILDDVVDFTKAAVDRIALYQPAKVPDAAKELARIFVECTEGLSVACGHLATIRNVADHEIIEKVNSLENQADGILKQGLADLFHHEPNAIEVMKWKEIYDYIEEAIDHCEDTVGVIEAALVKNS